MPQTNTISRRFERQAILTPDNIAVIDRTHQITYDELNRQANRAAAMLMQKGLAKEDFVG